VTRDARLYLEDILASLDRIRAYVAGMPEVEFIEDETQDAVLRRLEIIGEAVKNLPEAIRATDPDVPWRQIAGARDILIHHYARVDLALTWKTVTKDLPELERRIKGILEGLD
jgi:uncharacterized protein with HEPN domain